MLPLTDAQAEHILNSVEALCKGPKNFQAVCFILYVLAQRTKDYNFSKQLFLEMMGDLWDLECKCDKKI